MALGAPNWGDIPAWVTTVATLFALIFAAVAASSARRVYIIESQRDKINADDRRQEAEARRRVQAALVSAWCGVHVSGDRPGEWGIYIRNASDTPVHQARIAIIKQHEPDIRDDFDLAVLPPTPTPSFYPNKIWSVDSQMQFPAATFLVEMTFTDSAGVRWLRDQQGGLSEVYPELTIWADSQRTETLDRFSDDFLRQHRVSVRFEIRPIETMQDDFLAAIRAGQTPDVLIGPHDWIGRLVAHGAIEPISVSKQRREAFVQRSLESMTFDNKLYGIPYASDSIALLRNLDLAPEAPTSFEEMIKHGRSLCAEGRTASPLAIQVGTGDGFYVYPLYSSAGGRIFGRTAEGEWDPAVIAGPASTAAFHRLARLGERGEGILRREVDRDAAVAMFTHGRAAYLVCAPWGIGPAREAKVRFGVSLVPPFEGAETAQSLVAFHGFFMASAGRNKRIAQELILDYLTRLDVTLALYSSQPRTPALKAALERVSSYDEDAVIYRQQTEAGELIPSAADVADIWSSFHRAEVAVVAGDDVSSVLHRLHAAIVDINARAR